MALLYAVPRGTTPAVCKITSCRRPIYMVKLGGKTVAIDVDVPQGKAPSKLLPGQGALHRAVCREGQS